MQPVPSSVAFAAELCQQRRLRSPFQLHSVAGRPLRAPMPPPRAQFTIPKHEIVNNKPTFLDLQLATGRPPLADMHPMRALFTIPKSPPPELDAEAGHSHQLRDFIAACLQPDPGRRPTAARCESLRPSGYSPQVHVFRNVPNLCLHTNAAGFLRGVPAAGSRAAAHCCWVGLFL